MKEQFKVLSSEETRNFYDGLVEGKNKRGIWGMEKRFSPEAIASKRSVLQHFVPQVARYVTKDDKVLDLGCGPGGFMSLVAPLCKNIVAADIVPSFIAECSAFIVKHNIPNARAVLLEKGVLPFADNEFDVLIMVDVIHHLEAAAETLAEVARVLKPGGRLLVFEPNKLNPLLALLCALDKNEHGLLKLGTFATYRRLLGNDFTIDEQLYSGLLVGPDGDKTIAIANFLSNPKNKLLGWLCPKLFIAARKEKHVGKCRACSSPNLYLLRNSTITSDLQSNNFAITDANYGSTAAIYKCSCCGLLQCLNDTSVLHYYEGLEDHEYEKGRSERVLQAEKLVAQLLSSLHRENGKGLTLLDVGAGSGILVEVANRLGFSAIGIEPSAWLAKTARDNGLQVYEGVLPHPEITEKFSAATFIDVIEHVNDPLGVLKSIHAQLQPGGILLVVTPDVSSFCARVLGFKWWHYRIAHISYYNKRTLEISLNRAGFRVEKFTRPCWYFSYPYLRERLRKYLPGFLLPKASGSMAKLVVPLNLFDSLLAVCVKNDG